MKKIRFSADEFVEDAGKYTESDIKSNLENSVDTIDLVNCSFPANSSPERVSSEAPNETDYGKHEKNNIHSSLIGSKSSFTSFSSLNNPQFRNSEEHRTPHQENKENNTHAPGTNGNEFNSPDNNNSFSAPIENSHTNCHLIKQSLKKRRNKEKQVGILLHFPEVNSDGKLSLAEEISKLSQNLFDGFSDLYDLKNLLGNKTIAMKRLCEKAERVTKKYGEQIE
eukprot:snap_masked-scaffold_5-processed-gene-15.11-mRNA-1 protein AED:1.00 eAED:1.00 QI:0/0/0/0/1/1/5/0/223